MTWCKMLASAVPPLAGSILTLDILSLLMTSQGWGLPMEASPPVAAASLAPSQTAPWWSFCFVPFWDLQSVSAVAGCPGWSITSHQ